MKTKQKKIKLKNQTKVLSLIDLTVKIRAQHSTNEYTPPNAFFEHAGVLNWRLSQ